MAGLGFAVGMRPYAPRGPKTDYLALRRADYDRRRAEEARPVAYADLGAIDPGFDESRLLIAA